MVVDRKRVLEVGAAFLKRYSVEMCLADKLKRIECDGGIINSHTIPKSGSLKKIERKGHVYSFDKKDLLAIHEARGKILPQLMGVNKASTFKGFCGKHDQALFSPIETVDFEGTPEQCFLLFYRAYAKEVYNKKINFNDRETTYKFMESNEKIPLENKLLAKMYLDDHFTGMQKAINDINRLKPLMDEILENQDYAKVKALIIEFDEPLPFMVSGAVYPEQDFDGEIILDLLARDFNPFYSLGCTSFSSSDKGFFVFTWLNIENNPIDNFIESFLRINDHYKYNHLLKMTFNFFENIYMSPDWWESLDKKHKDYLVDTMNRTVNSLLKRLKYPLKYDGHRLPNIRFKGISKVNF
ncbi:hypothetical protein [Acinetobacter pittii]|uniref:hypothetical protein n=1 Tax=Acinetobacter pittii TaxID=48296 RepID=UPI001EE5D41F|nr:hypothetical protein [Acinetobacter pittii]MCG5226784.1 hypothetical protein [Acinetobacter pittii]